MNALSARSLAAVAALTLLPTPVHAQALDALPVHGAARHYELDLATGSIVEAPASASRAVTFSNTVTTGLYSPPATNLDWVDWGVKAGGASGIVHAFTFGYATTAVDAAFGGPGAEFEFACYRATTGFGVLGTQVHRQRFSGLPATSDGVVPLSFTVTVDLSSAPFVLPDGPIGWSALGTDGVTGPLLVATGTPGTGTIDSVDMYAQPAPIGTYLLTTPFAVAGIASLYVSIEEWTAFRAVPTILSVGAGGTQALSLNAGAAYAGKSYHVLGSFSGLTPGISYGGAVVPLNPGPYLLFTLANPNTPLLSSSAGTLDVNGQAIASLTLSAASPIALIGSTAYHAAAVWDFTGAAVTLPFVSNPAPVTFVP